MQGLGRTNTAVNPSSPAARRSSAAAAVGSCIGSMAAPKSRPGATAQ